METLSPDSATVSSFPKYQDSSDNTNNSTYFNPLDKTTPSLPLCLYYTQGCCTQLNDPSHLKAFDHSFLKLDANGSDLSLVQPRHFDYFLLLDLEGKKEILEFPLVMIDAKTAKLVDFFHKFVMPTWLSKEDTDQDVDKHFGQFGISSVLHDTAIPFEKVIQEFEDWMMKNKVWEKDSGVSLKNVESENHMIVLTRVTINNTIYTIRINMLA